MIQQMQLWRDKTFTSAEASLFISFLIVSHLWSLSCLGHKNRTSLWLCPAAGYKYNFSFYYCCFYCHLKTVITEKAESKLKQCEEHTWKSKTLKLSAVSFKIFFSYHEAMHFEFRCSEEQFMGKKQVLGFFHSSRLTDLSRVQSMITWCCCW